MIGIKGMDMPKSCRECNMTTCKGKDEPWNYVCSINLKDIDFTEIKRPEDCPLVEIVTSIEEPKITRTRKEDVVEKWKIYKAIDEIIGNSFISDIYDGTDDEIIKVDDVIEILKRNIGE